MLYPKPSRRSRQRGATEGPKLHGQPCSWNALYFHVIYRDRQCQAAEWAALTGEDHGCRDRFGFPHAPDDRWKLTLDHVPDENVKGLGMRREIAAPDDEMHLAALCAAVNVRGPSRELRTFMRKRIAERESVVQRYDLARRGDG